MKTGFILLFGLTLLSTGIIAQDLPEIERETKEKTYHIQEFDALQFEAIDPDKISTTTAYPGSISYEKSPTMVAPMGNYKDFKIIKITLPAKPSLMPEKKLDTVLPKQYLLKRSIALEDH
jgi:hypothetical protein